MPEIIRHYRLERDAQNESSLENKQRSEKKLALLILYRFVA